MTENTFSLLERALPFVAFAYSNSVMGAEELGLEIEAALAHAEQRGEAWYGHRFKEREPGIWRCDCKCDITLYQATPIQITLNKPDEQRSEVVASEWRKRFGENPLSSTRRSECDEYTWRLMVLCQDMMAALERTAPPAPVVPDDVAKDAARYRWVREWMDVIGVRSLAWSAQCHADEPPEPEIAAAVDDAIDAAMLAAAPEVPRG